MRRAHTLELEPLCAMELEIGEVFQIGRALFGSRIIGELVRGRLDGERLRARQLGSAAADWASVSDDGLNAAVYCTPEFETGDERYAWLNRTRIVGKGCYSPEEKRVDYQLFVMR